MAAEWCAYFSNPTRGASTRWSKTRDLCSAMALADKITDLATKTPLENGFTAYDAPRRHWSGVDTYGLIRAALARLGEVHWVRSVVTPASKSGGKPTVSYEINPEILRVRSVGKTPKYSEKEVTALKGNMYPESAVKCGYPLKQGSLLKSSLFRRGG